MLLRLDKVFTYTCFAILAVLVSIYPISNNGEPLAISEIVGVLLLLVVSIYNFTKSHFEGIRLVTVLSLFIYLSMATITSIDLLKENLKFGYVRFVYITIALLLLCCKWELKVSRKAVSIAIDILMLFVVIGNCISYLNIGDINSILTKYYTQYKDYITLYHLSLGKPILTFGVHNIAAFMYTGLFIISVYLGKIWNDRKYDLYSLVLLLLIMLTRCSTALVYVVLCISMLIFYKTDSFVKAIAATGVLGFVLIYAEHIGILGTYRDIAFQQENGFFARYVAGYSSIFSANVEAIRALPFGTGFSIAANRSSIYGADSGFIINYTVGKLFYVISFYILLVTYCVKNCNHSVAPYLIAYILFMEAGFITFYFYKTIAMVLLVTVVVLSTQEEYSESQPDEAN